MNTGNMSNDEVNVICNFIEQLNKLKMKTAMQQMIDWLYRQKTIVSIAGNQSEVDTYEGHISVATELFKEERKQIIHAYGVGDNSLLCPDYGETYYNSTFQTINPTTNEQE